MINLYQSLFCSIESTITTLACKETANGCIGKNSSALHAQRLSLLSVWRIFDEFSTLSDSDLNTVECWFVQNFGSLPILITE